MSGSSHIERPPAESPLLWPFLALLVICLACFTYYWDGHRTQFPYSTTYGRGLWPPPPDAANASTPAAAPAAPMPAAPAPAAPANAALGKFTGLKLPDGVTLNVPEFGIESKLAAYIQDSSKPVTKITWFDFDRLLFDTGKADLQPASQEQLRNIAAILKAFPKVHVRVGGYTDSTGDPDANLKLSDARATNVMNQLVKLGVGADRLDEKGYGSNFAQADNSTEAGRAKNRRISLRVTAK